MTLLAIDPGTDTGWAVFSSERRLMACGLGHPADSGVSPDTVIIECPERVYRGIPVAAILKLAAKAGEHFGYFSACNPRYVTPPEWIGGSVRKEINQPRIRAKLDAKETGILAAAEARYPGLKKGTIAKRVHNMVDAIGIGLFGVGR